MKRFFKLATLCMVVALFVTGCGMKEEFGIKIGKDKKVTIELVVAQDNEMIDSLMSMAQDSDSSKTPTDADRWAYLEKSATEDESYKDFKKAKYDKDGYKGYTYTLELGDIDNLVAESSDKVALDKLDKDAKFFTKDGDVYKLNLELGADQSSQLEQYKSTVDFDLKMKVTLPGKAKSNNATKVDGNTYIWDLTKGGNIELSFDFNNMSSSSNNNIVMIAGAVCAVVAIGIGVVVLTKKKNA